MSWIVTPALSTVKEGQLTCAGPRVATSCSQAAADMAPEIGVDGIPCARLACTGVCASPNMALGWRCLGEGVRMGLLMAGLPMGEGKALGPCILQHTMP